MKPGLKLVSLRSPWVAAFALAAATMLSGCGSFSGPSGSITEKLIFKKVNEPMKVVLTALGPGTFKVVKQGLGIGNGAYNFTSCEGTEETLRRNEAATCEAEVTPTSFESGANRLFFTYFKVNSYPEKVANTWLRQE